jgi:hypothetical protein
MSDEKETAVRRLVAAVWSNLFDPAHGAGLGAWVRFHLLETVVCALSIYDMLSWVPTIGRQTKLLYPTGIARFVDVGFLFDAERARLNVALAAILMVASAVGRFRAGYLLAFLCFHLQYCVRFGMGKLQHDSNPLGFALLALGLSYLAFDSREERSQAAEGWTVLLLSIGYFLAGVAKLVVTGPTWPRGSHLWHWIAEKRVDSLIQTGHVGESFVENLVLGSEGLATALLLSGLLTELASCMLWWRPVRRYIMLALVGMHVGIAVVMRITFLNNACLLLLLALPIGEVVDWVVARRSRWIRALG